MARAETVTWLSLDRWCQIIGTNPYHFNGVYTALSPNLSCNAGMDTWFQAAWQSAGKVSREDLAHAISDAEGILQSFVGYNLLPDWTIDDRFLTVRPAIRELFSTGFNPRFLSKSIQTTDSDHRRGYVISGGQKAKTNIAASAAIVRSDADGDGYSETCTVTVASTVTPEEVRVYFAGMLGAEEWELRPVKVVASGANLVITFKIYQVPNPGLWDRINAAGIDGDVAGNFQTTVDVYRVYNDPSAPLTMLWEPDQRNSCNCGQATCTACTFATQSGCVHVRDGRLGILAYSPASWDASAGQFNAADFSVCRDPERLRVWYYSGWRKETGDPRYRATADMDPYWESAVAYLATALLEREICACNNVQYFIDHWREDVARSNRDYSIQNNPATLGSPFGTKRGQLYAYQRCLADGKRIA